MQTFETASSLEVHPPHHTKKFREKRLIESITVDEIQDAIDREIEEYELRQEFAFGIGLTRSCDVRWAA